MQSKFINKFLMGLFSLSVLTAGLTFNPFDVHAALKTESVGADATAEISDDGKTLTITGTGAVEKLLSVDWSNANSYTHSNTVTTITDSDLVAIETIIIGEGITSIPDYCFATNEINGYRSCYNADTLQLPSTLESIGKDTFSGNSFEEIVIPDSVTSLGSGAFSMSQKATSLTIGSGVSSIAEGAFKYMDTTSSGKTVNISLETENSVALAYNWKGNGFTFGSDGNTAEFTVTGTISAITTVDVTIPLGGISFGIGEDGEITSQGVVIESNTIAPLTASVLEVEVLEANDSTNGLLTTTHKAPALVPVSTYTEDEWNNLSSSDTASFIALALKQVDVADDEAGVELTEATTDTLAITTPVELGNLSGSDALVHLLSGYGTASQAGINLETDKAFTNYGKNWANADDVVFRYLVTLEFALDQ